MLHTKFRGNQSTSSGGLVHVDVFIFHIDINLTDLKHHFKGFYYIWAWRPSWSCDPNATNELLFPVPKEAPHKILL